MIGAPLSAIFFLADESLPDGIVGCGTRLLVLPRCVVFASGITAWALGCAILRDGRWC